MFEAVLTLTATVAVDANGQTTLNIFAIAVRSRQSFRYGVWDRDTLFMPLKEATTQ